MNKCICNSFASMENIWPQYVIYEYLCKENFFSFSWEMYTSVELYFIVNVDTKFYLDI